MCYDFQKWTIISLSSFALALTVGLVSLAYGYIDPEGYADPKMSEAIIKYNALEELVNYCFQHASDSANPIQDLVDKGFLSSSEYQNQTCATVKPTYDKGVLGLIK